MAFITIAGENQIAKKQGDNETLNISKFVLAYIDGLGQEPSSREEAIPSEESIVDQLAITKSGYVNANQVVYSIVMGSDIGDYDFNWIGLVDDEGVLVGVSYVPTIQKRKNNGSVAGNTLTRNFLLAYKGIQQTAFISVPVETWQIDFNTRLNGIDERERLSNLDIYGHSSFFSDAWKVTKDSLTDGFNIASGMAYIGGIRANNALQQVVDVSEKPNFVWVDVSLQGDISDLSTVVEVLIKDEEQEDYTDSNGIPHYVAKVAEIDEGGIITDCRSIYENVVQHEEKDDPHPQYHDAGKLNAGTVPLIRLPPEVLTTEKADFVGSMHFFATETPPSGFLKANGAEISRITYAKLFNVIGTIWGEGDGLTTFNIPDARGEFLRGWDDGRGVDSGRLLGSWQEDEIASHRHSMTVMRTQENGYTGAQKAANGTTNEGNMTWQTNYTGGTETRPRNLSGLICIKY